ncbi:hypothetical protein N7495_006309 [Penicillium taxi]|uniref:uncharacterized protein n=1 Tax=Penicillium taxi TaxID=168475 RepID=UPI00254525F8|nr:uncharacterized protein N7495_006309 [Penicillium taxi]KAJ5894618.1 hypothetical protein N7495_006309 [Penicillium taxi]
MGIHIIIVGAGIAGLCAGIALRRAGHSVQIFEKSKLETETGAALALCPNGVIVLKSLGLDFEQAQACQLNRWEIIDGISLQKIAVQHIDRMASRLRSAFVTIGRNDLHRELLRLALDSDQDGTNVVKIRLGTSVIQVNQQEGIVTLDDNSCHRADLIIGADGLHSVVRSQVLPQDKGAVPAGLSAFRFTLPTEALLSHSNSQDLLRDKESTSFILADTSDTVNERHFVWYECRGGDFQNFVAIHPSCVDKTEDAKPQMLVERNRMATEVTCWPLERHEPLRSWTFGKVILIGDAAHSMLPFGGQGANQAIEDGGALGILLSDLGSSDNIPTRLKLFEAVRVSRASRVQILSNVRVGRESAVTSDLQVYLEPGGSCPQSFADRLSHDSGFDVIAVCTEMMRK